VMTTSGKAKTVAQVTQILLGQNSGQLAADKDDQLDDLLQLYLLHSPETLKARVLHTIHDNGLLMPKTAHLACSLIEAGLPLDGPSSVQLKIVLSDTSRHLTVATDLATSTRSDAVEDVIYVLSDLLHTASPCETRPFLTALTYVISSESLCGAAFLSGLPSNLSTNIEFLRVQSNGKRLMLPTYRFSESPPLYDALWMTPALASKNWCSDLVSHLAGLLGRGSIWTKLGHVFSVPSAAKQLAPIIFSDCYFSLEANQTSFLVQIDRFLKEYRADYDLHVMMLDVVVGIAERLLTRRKPGSLINLDFKRLGRM